MRKRKKADWLATVDSVEKRMIKIPAGARASHRINIERTAFRVALIEAYTAGKFSTVNAAPRAKKRRAS